MRIKGVSGRGRRKPGDLNKLEAEYQALLEDRVHGGGIEWYAFEAVKLRLAQRTTYTPDFVVMSSDGTIEMHEVKGFWEDDARVKIKVASEIFPFVFVGIRKEKGAWKYEYF